MKTPARLYNQLYQNLGYLFYGIAAADKKVNPKEFETLKQCVRKYWIDVETERGSLGSDAAFQMEVIFEILAEEMPDSYVCFHDFEDFKQRHEELFTQEINQLIWQTAESIASAFSGKNKSELVYLSRLAILLSDSKRSGVNSH